MPLRESMPQFGRGWGWSLTLMGGSNLRLVPKMGYPSVSAVYRRSEDYLWTNFLPASILANYADRKPGRHQHIHVELNPLRMRRFYSVSKGRMDMDIVKRLFRWGSLTILGIGATPWLAAQYLPPTAYSVTVTNSMFGTPVTMKIYRDGNAVLVDNPSGDTHSVTLYNLAAGTSLFWDAKDPASACTTGKLAGDWGDPFSAPDIEDMLKHPSKPPAKEMYNGFTTDVTEAVDPAQKTAVKVWREVKTGLYLRIDFTMPGTAKPSTVVESRNYIPMKPTASVFETPPSCKDPGTIAPELYRPQLEKFAQTVGGAAKDYIPANIPPGSQNACTMLLRIADSKMQPIPNTQVAIDLSYDIDKPPHYTIGSTFSGGHLMEVTGQLHDGVLRVDNVPAVFDLELLFSGGHAGASSATVFRHCSGPQTVLLFVKSGETGAPDSWMWVRSGKYAAVPGRR